jgi:hypothetical protein
VTFGLNSALCGADDKAKNSKVTNHDARRIRAPSNLLLPDDFFGFKAGDEYDFNIEAAVLAYSLERSRVGQAYALRRLTKVRKANSVPLKVMPTVAIFFARTQVGKDSGRPTEISASFATAPMMQ